MKFADKVTMFSLSPLVLALALVGACGSDGSDPDTGVMGNLDAGPGPGPDADVGADAPVNPVGDCVGAPKGQLCGDQGICIDGACVPSSCGDGYVDPAFGEECEDGNMMSGDGCSLCRFDCEANAECDDMLACNGSETCDVATHTCKPGQAAMDGDACMIAAGMAGVCKTGQCVKAGCGNNMVDQGEDCDDGNANDADGCTAQCKFTCSKNEDCDNGNACDGAETCEVATHTCKAGPAVICIANSCTGTCNPASGSCEYPDVDKDGATCDVDCADADPARFPGGFECKDGKDNDCSDATADNSAPSCECYVDTDRDGFAATVTGAIASPGTCPAGYTRTKPVDAKTTDCGPLSAAAFPGQVKYFPTGYCPGAGGKCVPTFDYNCDTNQTSNLFEGRLAAASCVGATNPVLCQFRSGWVGAQVPICGGKGTFRQCSFANGVCSGTDIANHPRSCR